MRKLVRITTVPISLEKLLEGQLTFMSKFYDVIAISADKERLQKYGEINKVRTHHVELTRRVTPFMDLKALFKLWVFLRKEKPAIVHTHTPKAGIIGMLAAKMAGVPIRLHTVAGLPLLETRGIKRRVLNEVEKFTYKLATNIYPNSHNLCEIILKSKFTIREKLKVLGKGSSNGIDTTFFDPTLFKEEDKKELRNKYFIPEKDLIFIFIGRLVSEKGISELVNSFRRLSETCNNVTLLLVGPYEEDLDPLPNWIMEEIEGNKKIISTGYKEDVRPLLSISDVLVFPSYREGFPNVVLQAGAMGLPSIVSNINGCNEIIQEGLNGLIVRVKNETSLYNAMYEMVINSTLRQSLAFSSRQEISGNYDRAEFWFLLLREYEKLELQFIKP